MTLLDVQVFKTSPNLIRRPVTRDISSTDYGSLDWAYWGQGGASDYDRKSGGTIFNDYTDIGTFTAGAESAPSPAFLPPISWTGGTPSATGTAVVTAVNCSVAGAGFRVTTSALGAIRRRIIFGVAVAGGATADVSVSLSDGSQPEFTSTVVAEGTTDVEYTEIIITVEAKNSSATLQFDFTLADTSPSVGRIILQSAQAREWPYDLVVYDTFTDSDNTHLTAHTPEIDLEGGGWIPETSTFSASPGTISPSDLFIVGNELVIGTGGHSGVIVTNSADNIVEVLWRTGPSLGSRNAGGPRIINNSEGYWVNTRAPNNDYTLYAAVNESSLGSLIGGHQPRTYNASSRYRLVYSFINGRFAYYENGEFVNAVTPSPLRFPTADKIRIGAAGLASDLFYEEVRVWRPQIIKDAYVDTDFVPSFGLATNLSFDASLNQAVSLAFSNDSEVQAGTIEAVLSIPVVTGLATQSSADFEASVTYDVVCAFTPNSDAGFVAQLAIDVQLDESSQPVASFVASVINDVIVQAAQSSTQVIDSDLTVNVVPSIAFTQDGSLEVSLSINTVLDESSNAAGSQYESFTTFAHQLQTALTSQLQAEASLTEDLVAQFSLVGTVLGANEAELTFSLTPAMVPAVTAVMNTSVAESLTVEEIVAGAVVTDALLAFGFDQQYEVTAFISQEANLVFDAAMGATTVAGYIAEGSLVFSTVLEALEAATAEMNTAIAEGAAPGFTVTAPGVLNASIAMDVTLTYTGDATVAGVTLALKPKRIVQIEACARTNIISE